MDYLTSLQARELSLEMAAFTRGHEIPHLLRIRNVTRSESLVTSVVHRVSNISAWAMEMKYQGGILGAS